MVNGFCFGGAFTQLCACDFAIAADEAVFGLSEVNWGIIPGGLVAWAGFRRFAVEYEAPVSTRWFHQKTPRYSFIGPA